MEFFKSEPAQVAVVPMGTLKQFLQMVEIYSNDGLHRRHPFIYLNKKHNVDDNRLSQAKYNHFNRKIRHLLPRGSAGLRLCMLHRHYTLIFNFIYKAEDYRSFTKKERKQTKKYNKARRKMI